MKGWSSTSCRLIWVSRGITRCTKPSPELSTTIVSFIAGASISTADSALSYFAPSMMFAQWISSASGAVLNPNLSRATSAIRLVQEI